MDFHAPIRARRYPRPGLSGQGDEGRDDHQGSAWDNANPSGGRTPGFAIAVPVAAPSS